jgi:hypothetical protein
MLGISTSNLRVGGFRGKGIDADATTIYNRIIADGGVSNLTRLNFFVKGLKTIYGSLANVPVCYDAHWIGYKLGSGTGATAGQAAAKLYSLTVAGDAVQATAASQPLLLVHNGVDNYWFSPQVNGNYCTAPSIIIPTASGFEMDVKVSFTTNDDSVNTGGWFASHDTGSSPNRNIFFGFSGSRTLTLYLLNLTLQATATAQFAAAFSGWLRVNATTVSSNMEVKYFTSTDGITFTQLGTTITLVGGANCIKTTAIKFDITGNGGSNTTAGKYLRAILKDANGVTRSDFNPATYNASTSQTQWTSATGEVWTINTGTATTGYKGVLVDRTIVMSDGVDDFVQNTTVLRGDVCSQYLAYKTENASASGYPFIDSASGIYLNSFSPEGANMKLYMNGSVSGLPKTLGTTLALFTATNNQGVLNTLQKNNDTQISNTYTPALSGTGVTIGKSGTGFFYQKGNINTYICITGADNTTVRTATYNLIRSLNNNAF